MVCAMCGTAVEAVEACYRCEVVPAQRAECPDAAAGCWTSCDHTHTCEPIFQGGDR